VKPIFREGLGYAIASGCALCVDLLVLWTLVRYFSWWYLAAATASFLSGVVVAYLLSVKIAFKHHRLKDRWAEFVGFAAIGTLGLAVNAVVMFMVVKYLGLHYLVAKGIAAAFTFGCNFISRRQILFVKRASVRGNQQHVVHQ
jgi:putative flippase GtrA